MRRGAVVLFCMFLTFISCQDEADCISVTTDFANVRFYSIETEEFDTVMFNSVQPVGSDSVLLADTTLNGVILLPLNPNVTTTSFAFDTEFGIDTLTLSYIVSTRIVSEDCGLEVLISGIETVRNDFDSIRIVNDVLNEDVNEDIRIYN